MIRIVLAEDHHVVRQALRTMLETHPDFNLVGETGDGLEVTPLVECLQPDVLLLDLMLPGLGGLEITRQVSQRAPQTHVVILSMHANEAYVVEALGAGAIGYVLKKSTSAELVRAIREAAVGQRYLSPPLSERLIDAYVQKTRSANTVDPYDTLTEREREVLHLVAEGHTNAEIAARLSISIRTVEMHRGHMMRKVGLRNQTDLVRYALRRGILPIEE